LAIPKKADTSGKKKKMCKEIGETRKVNLIVAAAAGIFPLHQPLSMSAFSNSPGKEGQV
jgi:hypothetical protein